MNTENAKHTAGPWKATPLSVCKKTGYPDEWSIDGSERNRALPFALPSVRRSVAEVHGEANARLIASAPEMAARIERLEAVNAELVSALEYVARDPARKELRCGVMIEILRALTNAKAKAA